MNRRVFALVIPAAFAPACGYRTGGRGDSLPRTLASIAIPPFGNTTTRYKLTDRLPVAITREFIARTRYRIVQDQNEADAVLQGAVVNLLSFPVIFDQQSGRATGVQMHVYLQLTLIERQTGKVLYTRPNMEIRQRYEISVQPGAYFEESDMALERLSQDVARTVVSSVLEMF